MSMIISLQAMLDRGQDNALLRYSLGSALLKEGEVAAAVAHLAEAVRQDPDYSAAWKGYGRALAESGDAAAAMAAYAQGIQVAQARGDKQAAREMQVFLRRLQKQAGAV